MQPLVRRWLRIRTRRQRRAVLLAVLIGIFALFFASRLSEPGALPFGAASAEIYFSGIPSEIYLNQTADLEVHVKSERSAINAAGVVVQLNPSMIDIVSMSTEQSFCSLYLENSFNARTGEARVACGTPQPGFSGDSVVMRLRLRFKQPGQTNITIDRKQSQTLANQPPGTDILIRSTPKLEVTIKQSI
jgi:hypothetical protein